MAPPRTGDPAGLAEISTAAVRQRWWVLGILSLLMGFGAISTDLYLPAMPAMGRSFDASAGTVEWTVSGSLIGFSLGQLQWGPVSDRHGRRLPVAIGLVLFVIGSVGCALSGSVSAIIAWRIVQAVGASAGVALPRAMVRDLYEGHRAAQMLSTLITVMAIAPLLGPIVGGQILALARWRAIFWTLVGVGLLTLTTLLTLPATPPAGRRNNEHVARALFRYGELLSHRRLLGYAGAGGFLYGGMFAYIAGTPFAYVTYHHVPAQLYGLLFAAGMVVIMTTNTVNSPLVPRFGSDRLLAGGAVMAAVSGIVAATADWTDWGGLWGWRRRCWCSLRRRVSSSPIPSSARSTVSRRVPAPCPHWSGHFNIVGSGLVGAFADGTPWPMGWVIALAGVGSLPSTRLVRPYRSPNAGLIASGCKMKRIVGILLLCSVATTASAQQSGSGPQRYAPPDMLAIAPGLADYTDAVLFGEIWKRPGLAPRDRSIITVAALITNGDAGQLGAHVLRALDNGVTPRELSEIITHLAFYAGWPKAVTAIGIVKGVFEQRGIKPEEVAADGSPPSALDQDAGKDHDIIIGSDARDVAPALAGCTSRILFRSLWRRPGLAARDRSLVTIAALLAEGQTDQLAFYVDKGLRSGLTRVEISEAVTHLAFYVGWPRAMSAAPIAKMAFKVHPRGGSHSSPSEAK